MSAPAPKFAAIDAHTHIENDGYEIAVDAMDAVGLTAMVNLTAGTTLDFKRITQIVNGPNADRFACCVQLDFENLDDPKWAEIQADGLEAAVNAGASALKEVKRLGLEIRWKSGELLRIDDPILDPVWDRCGRLGIPFIVHTSDPLAFHQPLTIYNERLTELQAHPDWVFLRPGLPSKTELLEARSRVMARHPDTKFVCVHFGNLPEDPASVAVWLEHHPNMYIDVAARFVEIGRHHPEMMRNFFIRYQDRILFGTDTGVSAKDMMLGVAMPSDGEFFARADFKEAFLHPFFAAQYRYLETDDYCIPSPTPIQGQWRLHGIALPDEVLKKVYSENAMRVIPGLAPVAAGAPA